MKQDIKEMGNIYNHNGTAIYPTLDGFKPYMQFQQIASYSLLSTVILYIVTYICSCTHVYQVGDWPPPNPLGWNKPKTRPKDISTVAVHRTYKYPRLPSFLLDL